MVARVHGSVTRAENRLEARPLLDVDGMLREDAERLAVPLVADVPRGGAG